MTNTKTEFEYKNSSFKADSKNAQDNIVDAPGGHVAANPQDFLIRR